MAAPSGIVWGEIKNSYGRIGIYVELTNSGTKTTANVQVWFWSKYSVSDTGNRFYYCNAASSSTLASAPYEAQGAVSINTTVSTGEGWSTSNQVKIGSFSYTYTRGSSAVTRYLYAYLTGIDAVGSSTAMMYANTSFTIPVLTTYTIKYNANGGTGAPANQTKTSGVNLTLSSTKPTRTGYSFQGWGTSASTTTVSYAAGATYTADAAITLYAVWKANTYKVAYNANGGSLGNVSNQTKTYGVALTLDPDKPTRTDYTFKGWATSASATSATYAAGGTYTANAAVTLYAVWELAYVRPRITDATINRCTADGTFSEDGTYARVKFAWETDYAVSAISIEWRLADSLTYTNSESVNASGTSGSVDQIVGSDTLSTDSTYVIQITVTDGKGSSPAILTLNGSVLSIDAIPGNKGIAFGKPAEIEGLCDIGFITRTLGGVSRPVLPNGSDFDTLFTPNTWALRNATSAGYLNIPESLASGTGTLTIESSGEEGQLHQIVDVCSKTNALVYERYYYQSGWGEWIRTSSFAGVVLWSGAYFMNASQTVVLSDTVSSQESGIVLVFSEYVDSAAKNYTFHCYYVPKHTVSTHNSSGHGIFMMNATINQACLKYLYIGDTEIKGHANNDQTVTGTSGITCTNSRFVLRYVIGV